MVDSFGDIDVFPAYAGVIPGISAKPNVMKRFPRTCGGDPNGAYRDTAGTKFSPHLRG